MWIGSYVARLGLIYPPLHRSPARSPANPPLDRARVCVRAIAAGALLKFQKFRPDRMYYHLHMSKVRAASQISCGFTDQSHCCPLPTRLAGPACLEASQIDLTVVPYRSAWTQIHIPPPLFALLFGFTHVCLSGGVVR